MKSAARRKVYADERKDDNVFVVEGTVHPLEKDLADDQAGVGFLESNDAYFLCTVEGETVYPVLRNAKNEYFTTKGVSSNGQNIALSDVEPLKPVKKHTLNLVHDRRTRAPVVVVVKEEGHGSVAPELKGNPDSIKDSSWWTAHVVPALQVGLFRLVTHGFLIEEVDLRDGLVIDLSAQVVQTGQSCMTECRSIATQLKKVDKQVLALAFEFMVQLCSFGVPESGEAGQESVRKGCNAFLAAWGEGISTSPFEPEQMGFASRDVIVTSPESIAHDMLCGTSYIENIYGVMILAAQQMEAADNPKVSTYRHALHVLIGTHFFIRAPQELKKADVSRLVSKLGIELPKALASFGEFLKQLHEGGKKKSLSVGDLIDILQTIRSQKVNNVLRNISETEGEEWFPLFTKYEDDTETDKDEDDTDTEEKNDDEEAEESSAEDDDDDAANGATKGDDEDDEDGGDEEGGGDEEVGDEEVGDEEVGDEEGGDEEDGSSEEETSDKSPRKQQQKDRDSTKQKHKAKEKDKEKDKKKDKEKDKEKDKKKDKKKDKEKDKKLKKLVWSKEQFDKNSKFGAMFEYFSAAKANSESFRQNVQSPEARLYFNNTDDIRKGKKKQKSRNHCYQKLFKKKDDGTVSEELPAHSEWCDHVSGRCVALFVVVPEFRENVDERRIQYCCLLHCLQLNLVEALPLLDRIVANLRIKTENPENLIAQQAVANYKTFKPQFKALFGTFHDAVQKWTDNLKSTPTLQVAVSAILTLALMRIQGQAAPNSPIVTVDVKKDDGDDGGASEKCSVTDALWKALGSMLKTITEAETEYANSRVAAKSGKKPAAPVKDNRKKIRDDYGIPFMSEDARPKLGDVVFSAAPKVEGIDRATQLINEFFKLLRSP